jgi:hypothetical protein
MSKQGWFGEREMLMVDRGEAGEAKKAVPKPQRKSA